MASNLVNKDCAGLSGEAEAYVESIMSSQRISRVQTPNQSNRKRHHSDTKIVDSTVKKQRGTVHAKRSLYGSVDNGDNGKGPVSNLAEGVRTSSVEKLIETLSADMHMLFSALSERVDKLEKGLEQRIANKVAQVIDKRMNQEVNKLRKDVESHCEKIKDSIREEFRSDIEVINTKIESLSTVSSPSSDISLNVVVRNFPESDNECLEPKVNGFIKDALRVPNIVCQREVRKESRVSSRPGVVIVTMKSHDDKRVLLSKKSTLRNNAQFSKVFLDHDKSFADRLLDSNFKAILSAVRGHELTVKGGRVVHRDIHVRTDRATNSSADRETSSSSFSSASFSQSSRRHSDDRHGSQHRDNRNGNRDSYSDNHRGGRGRSGRRYDNRGNVNINQRF